MPGTESPGRMSPTCRDRFPRTLASPLTNRWLQLAAGVVCMVMISSLQHGWTLFVNPIDEKYEWGRASIQIAFTVFILTETWLVPFEGWVRRSSGTQARRARWRPAGRRILGPELGGRFPGTALSRRSPGWHRRRLRLRTCWQCPEMVSRSPGIGRRPHGGGLRHRFGFHRHSLYRTIEQSGYQAAFLWFGLGQARSFAWWR